jgi:LysM repeat protein
METTPNPAECSAEPRTGHGFVNFISGHKLHATLLAGALVLGGASAAIAASPEPIFASSVSATASPAPEATETTAPEAPAPAAAEQPAELVVAPAAAEAAPAPAAEPAPAEAPAPEPAPPAPVDNSLQNNAYTVASGDTVGSIAARYGMDPAAMLAANGLNTSSLIFPGQVLKLSGPPVTVMVTVPAAPAAAPAPSAPRAAAYAPAPAPAAAPAPAPVPVAPAVRTIYVTGSGGQAAIDRCAGPVHFTPITESVSITEHDFCGGWGRFSGIQVGETVSIPGYGTYTAYARGNVPQGGTMNNVRAVLGGTPPVFLQTCIPGTSQMLVIGLH